MNIPASRHNDRLLFWIATTLVFLVLGLTETAFIAWCASLVTFGQLVAVSITLVLTGTGALFTFWRLRG